MHDTTLADMIDDDATEDAADLCLLQAAAAEWDQRPDAERDFQASRRSRRRPE